ncbi:zinc ribbon domain-containing protein [Streptomyces sp. NPDC090114]
MRACPACGASNDPTDDFCGNCGTYLGWSDTPPPPSRATTAPEDPPTGTAPAAPSAVPGRPPAVEPGADPAPADAPAAEPAGPAASARPVPSADPGRRAARPAAAEPEAGQIPDAPSATVPAPPALPVPMEPPAVPAVPAVPAPPALPDVTPEVPGAALTEGGPLSAARALGASLRSRLTGGGADEEGVPDAATPDDPAADAADTDADDRSAPRPSQGHGATPAPAPVPPAPPPVTPRPPAVPPSPAGSPPAPASGPVGPVLPAKPVAPRPVIRPTVVEEGDVVGRACPVCGTVNRPERRFCRRCAAELSPAEKPAPLPWWRTVWPFRRRRRTGSGSGFRFAVILAVVLALCAAGFLLLPAGRALIEDTRDKLGKATPITPAGVEASAAVRGHPATDTTDGLSDRYWGAPGPGASVTYTFRKPFRLVDLIITNGASTSPEAYARQGRALQVDLEVTAEDGTEHRKEITLSDKPGPQTIPTGVSDVKSVRLVLSSPAGLTKGGHLALAEVEFFQRS